MKPTLAVTIGDPAGVGPEVVLKALRAPEVRALAGWKIIGDRAALAAAAAQCGLPPDILDGLEIVDPGLLAEGPVQPGALRAEYGRAAMNYVRIATEMCLARQADAMVTAPLNKEAVTLAGEHFSGHTEYIAELCGAKESRMLLWNERLSVVHVSTHIPLRKAVELKQDRIFRTIELGFEAMQLMGKERPRIAVCGLNPHAGENRLFGSEDADVIRPAVEQARSAGMLCEGPVAPDTVFLKGARGAYDLIVAMYHDQGHIPMKLINFEETVNISLGIPIIRTSVDHGTAFDIAGKNLADARNMVAAMKAGASMAAGRLARRAAISGA
ncbi:MAG TPA: 4-hydroxythreonine-4-phosphate dehydrogenase PdxA [Acidobacteriaceae bacterium]|nr:4-hydroxythreonine-4-phosphate dehydrogenase PdxA [Acidobacteriaceae bacterium]